jgi:hypothetical protein
MTPKSSAEPIKRFLIKGVTRHGKPFRPSDWAERLCGVMSPFRPGNVAAPHAHLGYSPYVRPTVVDGVKAVMVDERLRALEPRAYDFVVCFARDNDLVTLALGADSELS